MAVVMAAKMPGAKEPSQPREDAWRVHAATLLMAIRRGKGREGTSRDLGDGRSQGRGWIRKEEGEEDEDLLES